MIAIGGVIIFGGYQLLVYGWDQITGGNAGFFQILVPGKYTNVAANDGPAATTPTTTGIAGGLTGPAGTLANAAGQPNGTGVGGSGLFGKGSLYGDTIGKLFG